MANNTAIVGRLTNIKAIEGADKIKLANVTVNGVSQAQVVVGLEAIENELVVYFTSNMCLNESTILKEYPDLATYLGRAGRVRTVKLRGVISDGLVVNVSKFSKWCKVETLTEGFEFTDLDGVNICKRYEPPVKHVTQSSGDKKSKKLKKFNRLVDQQVHFHYDTDNLRRNAHKLNIDTVVSISRKLHGTSGLTAHVLVKKVLTLKEKIAKFFGVPVVETEYDYIYTSRTVVKNANINLGEQKHFYGFDLWTYVGDATFKGKLAKGESVYYEIVGFIPTTGGAIQKGYGYGCKPNEYKVKVYRITNVSADGVVYELGWKAMLERCAELGVEPVETLYYGTLRELIGRYDNITSAELVEWLENKYLGKKAIDCNGRPDEGIVVRIDHVHQAEAYKLKDYAFLAGESAEFEKGTEDIEEGA
jgi:tRNA-binding EMAP/Myf-like protein